VTCYKTDQTSGQGGLPTTDKTTTVLTKEKIWSWVPEGARSKDGFTYWPWFVTGLWLSTHFNLEDGGSTVFRNVVNQPPHYTAQQLRKPRFLFSALKTWSYASRNTLFLQLLSCKTLMVVYFCVIITNKLDFLSRNFTTLHLSYVL
jgi:hypothetical protein